MHGKSKAKQGNSARIYALIGVIVGCSVSAGKGRTLPHPHWPHMAPAPPATQQPTTRCLADGPFSPVFRDFHCVFADFLWVLCVFACVLMLRR